MNNTKNYSKNIILAGLFLALTLLLPFLTAQIPQIGSAISPMHIPVLICGFVCGAPYGLAIGAIAPVLRFLLFGMPPIFPVGLAMTFELAVYGLCAGILFAKLPKKTINIYVTLILSMLLGRIAWGVAMFVIAILSEVNFSFEIFIAGAFVNAIPGIIVHIAVIPAIIIALQKAGFVSNERRVSQSN